MYLRLTYSQLFGRPTFFSYDRRYDAVEMFRFFWANVTRITDNMENLKLSYPEHGASASKKGVKFRPSSY